MTPDTLPFALFGIGFAAFAVLWCAARLLAWAGKEKR